jgi:hypothetical protein
MEPGPQIAFEVAVRVEPLFDEDMVYAAGAHGTGVALVELEALLTALPSTAYTLKYLNVPEVSPVIIPLVPVWPVDVVGLVKLPDAECSILYVVAPVLAVQLTEI